MDSRVSQDLPHVFLEVITTVSNLEQARVLAAILVEQYQLACVQLSEIESIYRWQETLCTQPEYRLSIKVSAARYPELESALRLHHPYELPAIYALAVAHTEPGFALWINNAENRTKNSNHIPT